MVARQVGKASNGSRTVARLRRLEDDGQAMSAERLQRLANCPHLNAPALRTPDVPRKHQRWLDRGRLPAETLTCRGWQHSRTIRTGRALLAAPHEVGQ